LPSTSFLSPPLLNRQPRICLFHPLFFFSPSLSLPSPLALPYALSSSLSLSLSIFFCHFLVQTCSLSGCLAVSFLLSCSVSL